MTQNVLANINKSILVDTCFWYALFTPRDQYHTRASKEWDVLKNFRILVPWPTLYEVINSEFASNKVALSQFEILLKKSNFARIEDSEYKNHALSETFEKAIQKSRPISLVDSVIRQMVLDPRHKIDFLLTYNEGDFNDILKKTGIQFFYL